MSSSSDGSVSAGITERGASVEDTAAEELHALAAQNRQLLAENQRCVCVCVGALTHVAR